MRTPFFKFPKPKFRKRKKIRATIARRPLRIAATANYDEMAEPNMKLSRALLIVLLLHVVAVSGIIAFNAIKTHQPTLRSNGSSGGGTMASIAPSRLEASPSVNEETKTARLSAKQSGKGEHAKSSSPRIEDSGKTYVVAKGDKPAAIAKKFKVSYDELLALNHIDDPRKLRVGQKLLIPRKIAKAKKADE
jgi:LysM repeat protein